MEWAKEIVGAHDWSRLIRPLEEWTINMVYHSVKQAGKDVSGVYLDVSKSFERQAFRTDHFSPSCFGNSLGYRYRHSLLTPYCNSVLNSFAGFGFDA